jgi:hypothetical protein
MKSLSFFSVTNFGVKKSFRGVAGYFYITVCFLPAMKGFLSNTCIQS